MLWILGPELLTQPWLLVGLALYAVNLAVAAFVSRPNLRRLIGLGGSEADDDRRGAGARASSGTWRTAWRR